MQLDQAIAQLLTNASNQTDTTSTPASKLDTLLNSLFSNSETSAAENGQLSDAAFAQLAKAAAEGKTEIFTALVDAEKAEPPSREPTLLMAAVMANQLSVAQALLAAGADVNTKIKEFFEFNALHFAVKNENIAMVALLLEAGADPNWANANPGYSPIVKAIKQSRADIVKLLLDHGAQVKFETGFKPLVQAAQYDSADIISLLLDAGCNPNDADFNGSALKVACTRCNVAVIQKLLEAGAETERAAFLSIFGAPFMAKQLSGLLGDQPDPTAQIPAAIQTFIDAGMDVNVQGQDGTTALILAICENYGEVVNQLLTAGADPNLKGKLWAMLRQQSDDQEVARQYGYITTPLNLAAAFGYADIVRSLLANGADLSLADEKGALPVNIAIKEGHQSIIELLKAAGASVNEDDREATDAALIGAAKKGHIDILRSALSKGANPNASQLSAGRGKREKTALMFAAEQGHLEAMKQLIASGADVNLSDRPNQKLGKTPLMCAAQNNHADIARCLLKSGAAIDTKDKRGQTALFYAVETEATETVEVLIEAGADVQKKSWDGTPFEIAAYTNHRISKLVTEADKQSTSPQSKAARVEMMSAAAFGGNATLIRELLHQGVSPDAVDEDGGSTLMMAAAKGHSTIVQILLAAGATVDLADCAGETALFKAAYWGKADTIELLISAGADVNRANSSKMTPLMSALAWNSVESVKLLLKAGANATVRNSDGRTVLAIALAEGKSAIAQTLKDAGITA